MNRLLLVVALIAMVLGIVIVLHLPIGILLRVAGVVGWCFMTGYEVIDISSSHKRFSRLRVSADGSVQLYRADGQWIMATLHHGCVVLSKLAWLNLHLTDGRRYCVLLRGDAVASQQWRRLQVIWRHLGPARGNC